MAEDKKVTPDTAAETKDGAAAEGAAADAPAPKKKSMLLFIILGAVVVLGAAAGGFFMLSSKPSADEAAAPPPPAEPIPAVFFDMPDLMVNLASGPDQQRYLKLRLTLELPGHAPGEGGGGHKEAPKPGEVPAALQPVLPRIIDDFQIYLRELRAEDLQGSVGTFRLKQALLLRANQAAHPVEINNVLIKELLVQ